MTSLSLSAFARSGFPRGGSSRAFVGFVALALLLVASLSPATAHAARSWQPSVDVLPGQNVSSFAPQVAVDGKGNAVAVWSYSNSTTNVAVVRAATRPARGAWSAPQDLSVAGEYAYAPSVDIDAAGNAVAIWQRDTSDSSHSIVRSADLPADALPSSPRGGWTVPENLSTDDQAQKPRLAVDEQGNAVVAWNHFSSTGPSVQVVTRAANGVWSPLQDISAIGDCCRGASVDISGGHAVVGWTGFTSSDGYTVEAATRSAGASPFSPRGGWSEAQKLATGVDGSPSVAIDPQGNGVAAWPRQLPQQPGSVGDADGVVEARSRPAGGSWSNTEEISAREGFVPPDDVQVDLDGQGNAVALWSKRLQINIQQTNHRIEAASRPVAAGGSFQAAGWNAPQTLSTSGQTVSQPQLAVSSQGNAVALWRRFEGANDAFGDGDLQRYIPVARVGSSAGSWEPERDLWEPPTFSAGQVNMDTALGIGPMGDAMAMWSYGRNDAPPQFRSAAYEDPTPPPVVPPPTGGGGGGTDTTPPPGTTTTPAPSASETPGTTTTGTTLGTGAPQPQPQPGTGTVPFVATTPAMRAALRRCITRANRLSTRARRRAARIRCERAGRPGGPSASATSASEIILSFRAPGSVGRGGPPARRYVIKQSTKPIRSERDFGRALTLCGRTCPFTPQTRGQRLSLRITGLRSKRTYYYAVKAVGAGRRTGPRSETAKARTR